ncbi:MAG: molecular chaperone [Chloroflexi bacterium]|nr:molecular chaperone [Chloroflexota bacterium]
MHRLTLTLLIVALALLPGAAWAQAGVGINVGSIQIDQDLAPGGIYNLPAVGVINTGNESSDYSLRITYLADRPEMRPSEDWFSFNPPVFRLEPGEDGTVGIRVHVPVAARSGDYFALLEAYPVPSGQSGALISVAAATKLSFTVRPSNVFTGSLVWGYHRMNDTSPYSYIVLGLLMLVILGFLARRFLRFDINVTRR